MIVFFIVLALIIAILAVIFAIQNAGIISVVFFSYSFEGSLALILLITFALGVLVGILLLLPYLIRAVVQMSRLSKENSALDEEDGEDDGFEADPESQFD